jgi:arylsulfatase A-like enzyme
MRPGRSSARGRSIARECSLGLIVAIMTAFQFAPATAADAPRWNILFVFADDWGRYAGCYRGLDGRPGINDVVETPAVDRLAREGVVFRNAFVNAPSCTPCRSSLLSGRYFFNCGRGAILLGAVWDDAIPTFPLELEKAGYRIGKSFKVWSPGKPADQPFGGQRHAYEKAGRMSSNFSESATRLVAKGSTVAEARERILAEVGGNFDAFLADASAGGGDTPWLYMLGTTTTHRRWVKGSGKALWGIDPERLTGRLPAFLPDVPEVREDVADYLGEVRAVDASIGVLLDRLAATGQLDRTLVIVSGDHGMPGVPAGKCDLYDHGTRVALVARVPGGTPGRVVDDFVSLPDLAPTFMEIGGVAPPPGIAGRSILPLLRSDRSGQIDPSRTWVITGRERHVASARAGNLPYPMRAIRTADHLYIRNFAPDRLPMGSPGGVTADAAPDAATLESDTFAAFADMDASPTKAWVIAHRADPRWSWLYDRAFGKRPAEELYDLRSDPDQLTNVADRPDHAAVKEKLSRQLTDILTQAGDPRLAADVPFEKPPFTDAAR